MGPVSSCSNSFCRRQSELSCECNSQSFCFPCLSSHMSSSTGHRAYFHSIPDDLLSSLCFTDLKYLTRDHNTELYEASSTSKKYAVKIQYCANSLILNKKQEEANLMRSIHHDNICRCIKSFIYSSTSGCRLFLIMEYCSSDLEEEILTRLISKNRWSEKELLHHMYGLIDAFSCMQQRNMVHRDIKPANILIENNTMKIADFGLSMQQETSITTIEQQCAGTVSYLSPLLKETYIRLIEGKSTGAVVHNPVKSDVYSLGLTFLHMASLLQPCLSSGENLKERVERAVMAIKYSGVVKDIIREMLEVEERKRKGFVSLQEYVLTGIPKIKAMQRREEQECGECESPVREIKGNEKNREEYSSCGSEIKKVEGRENNEKIGFSTMRSSISFNDVSTRCSVTRLSTTSLPSFSEFNHILHDPSLTSLYFSDYSPLSAMKCKYLSEVLPKYNLNVLDLEDTSLDIQGLNYLISAIRYLYGLCDLNLSRNCIEAEGARELSKVLPKCSKLKILRMWKCRLGDEGVMWISKGLNCTIEELFLAENNVRVQGCLFLGKIIKSIKLLSLIDNFIGDEGAKLISNSLYGSNIQKLFLDNNGITDIGGKDIMERIPSQLERLRLNKNIISKEFDSVIHQCNIKAKITY